MKTMKKLICIVLSLLMVFSVAACDEKETESKNSSKPANNSSVVDDTSSDTSVDATSSDASSQEGTSSKPSQNNTTSNTTSMIIWNPGTNNSGSGGNTEKPKQTSLTWKQVKAKMPKDASGKSIELMDWNSQTPAQKGAIQKFTKETGIKVTFTEEGYSTYLAKIASRVATGNPPTVVRLRDNIPSYMMSMQPINKTGYDFNDTYWDQDILMEYNVNGLLYGVNLESSPFYQPMVTFYNQALIDKYDLDDPYDLWKSGKWTWDKMFEMCEEFIDEAGTGYGGLSTLFGEYIFSTGNAYYTYKNNQYSANLRTTGFVKAMQYMNTAYHKGYISDIVGNDEDFNLGKLLFLNEAEIAGRSSHFMLKDLKNKGTLRAVPIPSVSGQKEYYVPICENEAYGVPNRASNIELVPYFLRFYLDTANYNMNTFYADKTILETVEWTRSQKRIPVLYQLSNTHSCLEDLLTCSPSQIATLIDQKYSPAAVNGVNDATAKIPDLVK